MSKMKKLVEDRLEAMEYYMGNYDRLDMHPSMHKIMSQSVFYGWSNDLESEEDWTDSGMWTIDESGKLVATQYIWACPKAESGKHVWVGSGNPKGMEWCKYCDQDKAGYRSPKPTNNQKKEGDE